MNETDEAARSFSAACEALVLGGLSSRDEQIVRAFMLANESNQLTTEELDRKWRETSNVMRFADIPPIGGGSE